MRKVLSSAWLFIICLSPLGCTPVLTVKSEPSGATVYAQMVNEQKQELGKTPFDLLYTDLEKVAPLASVTGEMIPLTFEKEAHDPVILMVPSVRIGLSSATITAKLKPIQESTATADHLLQFLHNAQKFANAGNYQRALEEADKAFEKDPKFIRALSMKGSIYFMQSRWDDSLIWYEKALALDNGFEEAVRMIAEIKKKKGAK